MIWHGPVRVGKRLGLGAARTRVGINGLDVVMKHENIPKYHWWFLSCIPMSALHGQPNPERYPRFIRRLVIHAIMQLYGT